MATSLNESDGDFGFQIAPLVDVVFVLLLFFMACAGMKQVEGHLTTRLAGPSTDPRAIPDVTWYLDITADGSVALNGQVLATAGEESLDRLQAKFQAMTDDTRADQHLIIRPSLDATSGRVIQALGEVNKAGFKKINFQ